MSVTEIFQKVADAPFRSRVLHEYGTVRKIVGKRIDFDRSRMLDFGCGAGIAVASFALRHQSAHVFGTDIIETDVARLGAMYQANTRLTLPNNLFIEKSVPGSLPPSWSDMDLIFAWSVFEHVHFDQIVPTMRMLKSHLKPTGYLFIQINPLYFSPRGSHLYRYAPGPWAHLEYQINVLQDIVMASSHPEARKQREWDQFMTLNRATADDIVTAAHAAGFSVLEQERLGAVEAVPGRLASIYSTDVLLTNEIRLLLGRT